MALLSANIAICETVIWETNNVPTLVRVLTILALGPGTTFARFSAVTGLNSQPGDYDQHTLQVMITDRAGNRIDDAKPYNFVYGYKIDPAGPGGFILTTAFNLNISQMQLPLHCLVSAFLDNQTE